MRSTTESNAKELDLGQRCLRTGGGFVPKDLVLCTWRNFERSRGLNHSRIYAAAAGGSLTVESQQYHGWPGATVWIRLEALGLIGLPPLSMSGDQRLGQAVDADVFHIYLVPDHTDHSSVRKSQHSESIGHLHMGPESAIWIHDCP